MPSGGAGVCTPAQLTLCDSEHFHSFALSLIPRGPEEPTRQQGTAWVKPQWEVWQEEARMGQSVFQSLKLFRGRAENMVKNK